MITRLKNASRHRVDERDGSIVARRQTTAERQSNLDSRFGDR